MSIVKKYLIYTVFLIIGSLSTILINQYIETSKIHTIEGSFTTSDEEFDCLKYEVKIKYRNNKMYVNTDIYCSTKEEGIIHLFNVRYNQYLRLTDKDGFILEEIKIDGNSFVGWNENEGIYNMSSSIPITLSNYKVIDDIQHTIRPTFRKLEGRLDGK